MFSIRYKPVSDPLRYLSVVTSRTSGGFPLGEPGMARTYVEYLDKIIFLL